MPRLLRVVGLPLVGVLLVLFFVYLGFPYERLARVVATEAGRLLGARVDIQEVGPRLALTGPGFEARGVRASWENGRRLQLERAAVRPAWSLAWLRGTPALYAELESPLGTVEGTWVSDGAWYGDVRALDLSAVPLEALWRGAGPEGRLDARVDLRWSESGPEGDVSFEAREGSLRLPDLPTALPYQRCRGVLVFGGESFVAVESFSLEGPLLSVKAKGTLGRAARFESSPLQLELELKATQPGIQSILRSAGLRLGRDGSARVRVTGTPSAPLLR